MPLPALLALAPLLASTAPAAAGAAGAAPAMGAMAGVGKALASPAGQATLTGAKALGKRAAEKEEQQAQGPLPSEMLASAVSPKSPVDPFKTAAIKRRYAGIVG